MPTKTDRTETQVAEAGKQRMQRWLLSSHLRQHMQTASETGWRGEHVGPHITISREAGTRAVESARVIGELLGWDVLGKELLDFMSQRYRLPREMLNLVDETKSGWVHDIFGDWFDSRVVSHEKYLVHLERVVWLAAIHGEVVVVGRGANCVLPRHKSLNVRIVAPREYRISQAIEMRGIDKHEAAKIVDSTDNDRRDFVRRYFHQDIDDPHNYDLTINAAIFKPEMVAQQVVSAYRALYPAST